MAEQRPICLVNGELVQLPSGDTLPGGGIAELVEDTTPELGGNLDALTNNITNLGQISIGQTQTHEILKGGTQGTDMVFESGASNATDAIAFRFRTKNNLINATAKVFSIIENTTEHFYLNSGGNVFARDITSMDAGSLGSSALPWAYTDIGESGGLRWWEWGDTGVQLGGIFYHGEGRGEFKSYNSNTANDILFQVTSNTAMTTAGALIADFKNATTSEMQLTYDGILKVDNLTEITVDAGVTIEGNLLKDNGINGVTLSAAGGGTLFLADDGSYKAAGGGDISDLVLSTEYWNLTNGSYDSVLKDVSTNTTSPNGIFFKPDGTEMYLANGSADQIDQYTLSSAWDITSATYTGAGSTASELYVYNLWFRPDGKKVYTAGSSGWIRQWSLGTAWDITTISFDSVSLQVTAQDSLTRGLYMRSDGLRFYVASSTQDEVNEYFMATAWDLSTAGFKGTVVDLTAQDSILVNVFFTPNGDRMFALGEANDAVFQYTLSVPWDVSTATYDTVSLSVNSEETSPSGFFFKPDGTKMYLVGGSNKVHQYSTPGDDVLSRATETQFGTLQISTDLEMAQGAIDNAAVTPKKLKTWIDKNIPIEQFTPIGWDLLNAQYLPEKSVYIGTQSSNMAGVFFKSDGTEMYVAEWDADKIDQYTLTKPWDVTTITYTGTMDTSATGLNVYDIWLSADGTRAFICTSSNIVYQYDLGTAWDISSGTYNSVSYALGHTYTYCFFMRDDGMKMYTVDSGLDQIVQHSLSTAWDLSTASADSKIKDVSSEDTFPVDVFFKEDGSEMFIVGSTNNRVYKYTLSTEWDVSSATYDFSIDLIASNTNPYGIFIRPGGGLMFITDAGTNHMVYCYDLSSSNELASATETAEGIIQLATQAEVDAGTDAVRAITPKTLASYVNDKAIGRRNVIINGDMSVSQRGSTFTTPVDDDVMLDMWHWAQGGTGGAAVTVTQDTDVPTYAQAGILAKHSLKIAVTTADATVAASAWCGLVYKIEGYDYTRIAGGDATLSFWVKTNLTGTYSVSFKNSNLDRSYVSSFTVSASGTWEKHTITIPLTETGGTWDYEDGLGLSIYISLHTGTDYQTGSANTWVTGNYATLSGNPNLLGSTSYYMNLTLVQFEPGQAASPFEMQTRTEILQQCYRYYQQSYPYGVTPGTVYNSNEERRRMPANVVNTANFQFSYAYSDGKMRIAPTVIVYSPTSGTAGYVTESGAADRAVSISTNRNDRAFELTNQSGVTVADGAWVGFQWTADASL